MPRRRLTVLLVVAAVALAAGVAVGAGGGKDGDPGTTARDAARARAAREAARPQLPGGGRRLFPDRRIVAYYGNPADDELGELGIGTPAEAARRLLRQAKGYHRESRPVLPAFELIATIANADPGRDGMYRSRMGDALIRRYHRAARRAGALLILDIQPGRAPFGPEIEHYAKYLREPDVGLALDPEWHVGPGQVPGRVIGSMDARAVNGAAAYLSKIVREHDLPEKLLLVHRFTFDMIRHDDVLAQFPGVQTVVNVDGFGSREVKVAKYRAFVARTPRVRRGFKLFYREDAGLMRPRSVMAMRPRPDVVVYE